MQPGPLDALLEMLGGGEEAGDAYLALHLRLVRFFRLKNGSDPESLADEALDRLAANITSRPGGVTSLQAFALGIARHLLQEDTRRRIRDTDVARDWHLVTASTDNGSERLLQAIDTCLATMPEAKQELLRNYYEWTGTRKIDHHRQTAEHLGLTVNALRNRLMRARNDLDSCVRRNLRDVSVTKDITGEETE